MTELTGKQKRFLRAKANRLKPVFSVGKNGLSKLWLTEINKALDNRELIKISIQKNADLDSDDVKSYIENDGQILVVQTIGKNLVLFKPSKDEDKQNISKQVFDI